MPPYRFFTTENVQTITDSSQQLLHLPVLHSAFMSVCITSLPIRIPLRVHYLWYFCSFSGNLFQFSCIFYSFRISNSRRRRPLEELCFTNVVYLFINFNSKKLSKHFHLECRRKWRSQIIVRSQNIRIYSKSKAIATSILNSFILLTKLVSQTKENLDTFVCFTEITRTSIYCCLKLYISQNSTRKPHYWQFLARVYVRASYANGRSVCLSVRPSICHTWDLRIWRCL